MTATKYLKIYLCFFLPFVSACVMLEPDIPEYDTLSKELLPEMQIVGAEQIYPWQAVLKIRIKGRKGIKPSKIIFCYSKDNELPGVTDGIDLSPEYTNDTIEVRLTSLLPATLYYCRLYAETADEKGYSDTFQFKTTIQNNNGAWTKVCEFPDECTQFSRAVVMDQDVYIMGHIEEGKYLTGKFVIWKYTPSSNNWTKIKDYPGGLRIEPVLFGIGSKLYMGLGDISNGRVNYCQLDFWAYDTRTEDWTRICDYPREDYAVMTAFSYGGKGYVSTVSDKAAVFEYDPSSNNWTRKSDFPGAGLGRTLTCVVGNRVFMFGGVFLKESEPPLSNYLWEYHVDSDSWFRHADFPGTGRWAPVGFAIGGNLYAGHGSESGSSENSLVPVDDFWSYSIEKDMWEPRSVFPPAPLSGYLSLFFAMDNVGYAGDKGTGLWKYQPE